MNGKIFKASAAGAAAVVLLTGGTTFAKWSDWALVSGSTATAGTLALHVDAQKNTWTDVVLTPGKGIDRDIFVASADGKNVPDGNLSFTVTNLVNKENGCASDSEKREDPDCGATNAVGDLANEALVDLGYYPLGRTVTPTATSTSTASPSASASGSSTAAATTTTTPAATTPAATTPASCNEASYQSALTAKQVTTVATQSTLGALVDKPYQVGLLHPGQAICVRVTLALPVAATNASQGDSVAFDTKFTLDQVV